MFELMFYELHLVLHLSFERHQDKIVMLDLKTNNKLGVNQFRLILWKIKTTQPTALYISDIIL